MITRTSKISATLNLNEYIESFSEVKPHLDDLIESSGVHEVRIVNDGCKGAVIRKVTKYLADHDIETWR